MTPEKNVRSIRRRSGSLMVAIPSSMAADKQIEPGSQAEWRSFPQSEEEWARMRREHPNALVLIPREE